MAPSSANGVPDREGEGTGTEPIPGTRAEGSPSAEGGAPEAGASLSTDQLLERLAADAQAKLTDFVARRTRMAEQKIAQAEAQATADVRAAAADAAEAKT
jgi:hypothetical protein